MPGASPSRRNSLPLIAVWTPGGDRGRWTSVFMQTAEEQHRLAASDVCSPPESDSSVYRLNSCVHSSRVGVFDRTVWPESFKVARLALFMLRPLGHEMERGGSLAYLELRFKARYQSLGSRRVYISPCVHDKRRYLAFACVCWLY